jgi:predicted nuclease of restriction endonuclease-like RecB superfamily
VLTAELVNARRRGGQLRIVALDDAARARAAELAELFLALARDHVGRSREELEEAWDAIAVAPQDRRLADGIRKLVEDRCELDAESAHDPAELRRALFLRAAAARRDGGFDRQAIVDETAARSALAREDLEREIYADLRGAHVLRAIAPTSPGGLADAYDLGQAQAVLLRAVRVSVEVECSSPGAYRALFRKLKFLRLLHSIRTRDEGGYRIDIDGPYSLFDSVTKYGLQLALALPVIRESDRWRIEADVRWGKDRTPLVFRLEGGRAPEEDAARDTSRTSARDPGRLPDDVDALVRGIRALDTPWKVSPASTILDLPGVGLCVPDLLLEHRDTGDRVHLEVLGFWSREAVWRRVELVERGLGGRILFAVSQHLRVSQEALGDDRPGALYVYKRVMNARAVLERVEALARRPAP